MRSEVLFFIVLQSAFCTSVFAYDWSDNPGNGDLNNPYQISEPNHLMAIGADADLLDKHFILMNDIVFDPNNNSNHVFDKALIAPDASTDFNFQGAQFSGIFDGNSKTIYNLKIMPNSEIEYIGLFGCTHGTIKNLRIENANIAIVGNAMYCGVLAGKNEYIMQDCVVSGSISGKRFLGGLVGWNWGTIQSCTASVSIDGTVFSNSNGGLVGDNVGVIKECRATGANQGGSNSQYLGGLVGFTGGGAIMSSAASGNVSAGTNSGELGGLVGRNWSSSEISNCYATGSVSGVIKVGGLTGWNSGPINRCFATGSVIGPPESTQIGGLVGNNDGSLADCYATGLASGDYSVGGLVGVNAGSITTCYAAGSVSGISDVGGLLGDYVSGSISHCYYLNTAGPHNRGVPLNETAMKQQNSFVGWDFVGESANGENEIWRMCVDGVAYPRLSWEFAKNGDFACGDGVDVADLQALTLHWLTAAELTPTTFNYACDANGDEQIDLLDFGVVSENWP